MSAYAEHTRPQRAITSNSVRSLALARDADFRVYVMLGEEGWHTVSQFRTVDSDMFKSWMIDNWSLISECHYYNM